MFKKLLTILTLGLCSIVGIAQQPQTNDLPPTQPIYSTNAKYTNGVAPGYWPTGNSTGLTLNISSGTSFCNTALQHYAGGTLTMTANTTNYVYLDINNSCVPAVSTSVFVTNQIPVAKVVTGSSNITSIEDDRTFFTNTSGGSGIINIQQLYTPQGTGNYILASPISCSASGPGSLASSCSGTNAGTVGGVGCFSCSTDINWIGINTSGLPSGATITGIYASVISGQRGSSGSAINTAFSISNAGGGTVPGCSSATCFDGPSVNNSWPITQKSFPFSVLPTNYAAFTINDHMAGGGGSTFTGLGVYAVIYEIDYSGGTPPPVSNTINVAPPLCFINNTICVEPNWPNFIYPTPVAGLPTPSAATNLGYTYLVPDGANATDCVTGGGSNKVLCESTGTGYVGTAIGGSAVTPGGSNGNLQYNNAGAFGGDSNTNDDGAGNITAKSYSTNSSMQGAWLCGVGTGTIVPPANAPSFWSGFSCPTSGSINYLLQFPSAAPSGLSVWTHATPTTVNGQSQSAGAFELISDFAKLANNNTFFGTQTFNNIIISGTCTGCGGGGGSGGGATTNVTGQLTPSGCSVSGGVCTVGTATNTITLASIPSGINMVIVINGSTSASGNTAITQTFNGDTGAHYYDNYIELAASGSTAVWQNGNLDSGANQTYACELGGTTLSIGSCRIYYPAYSGSTMKSFQSPMTLAPTDTTHLTAWPFQGGWNQTAAITSVTFSSGSANFAVGTTFSVFIETNNAGNAQYAYSALPVPSSLSGFTTTNIQTGTTATQTTAGVINIYFPNVTTCCEYQMWNQAVPGSTPWRASMYSQIAGRVTSSSGGFNASGLELYDGTKLETIDVVYDGGATAPCGFSPNSGCLEINHVPGITGGGSNVWGGNSTNALDGALVGAQPSSGLYYGFCNDGTNIYAQYSMDGVKWFTLYQEAVGSFITPTSVGFFGAVGTSSTYMYLSVKGWSLGSITGGC